MFFRKLSAINGQIRNALTGFWDDQSGAITVDWVVLTAAAIAISVPTYNYFVVDDQANGFAIVASRDPSTGDWRVSQVIKRGKNGISKIVATANLHATVWVNCIFNQEINIENPMNLSNDVICDYFMG